MPSVEVRLGAEVVAVEPDASGGTLRDQRSAGLGRFEVRAGLVVGCDGARSRGPRGDGRGDDGVAGSTSGGSWWTCSSARGSPLPDRLLQIADPRRPTTYVPFADPRRRWEFRLRARRAPRR